MGLTFQSMQSSSLKDIYQIEKTEDQFIIALAGNPNTGKSTVFNVLTGLHQHTGNWPGKTVINARGEFKYRNTEFILVDLPGTYSLFASSAEEEVARDFICFGNADAVIVVSDATCLERNLNLVFQVMEVTDNMVLCINLMDEARKKNIQIDAEGLEKELGIPVVLCAARNGTGIKELKDKIYQVINKELTPLPDNIQYSDHIEGRINQLLSHINDSSISCNPRWLALRMLDGDEKLKESIMNSLEKRTEELPDLVRAAEIDMDRTDLREEITGWLYRKVEEISHKYVTVDKKKNQRDRKIDDYITSRIFGVPIMLALLALILWITISGANIPSAILADFLFGIENRLSILLKSLNAPVWLHGILILGLFRTMSWVISVMLPPMAIFFPLFTLLEDLGYLPRVAFNLDHLFKKACAHGKQCLTMCMGFGCNAAGITSCRIIDSPRERLIAMLTNNFVPCNGRFPTLIAISTVFFAAKAGGSYGLIAALWITALIILGIGVTLCVSYGLSKTLLKGIPSTFTLELPPYRIPQIGRVLYTSIIDRTVFVLWRAVVIAIPAGVITWLFANLYIGDLSIIGHVSAFLDPFARLMGLDGYILMAFILGIPANEIVLPILLMCYLSTGSMIEYDSLDSLRKILMEHGWTYLTALNVMLFSLLHWPCATTLMTIRKETGSTKWTILAGIIPTSIAILVCLFTSLIFHLLGIN